MSDETKAPEFYADSVQVGMTVYGLTLEFGLQSVGPPPAPGSTPPQAETVATVRMSPQLAHIMARLLVQATKRYDSDVGKIELPDTLYAELGLPKDV